MKKRLERTAGELIEALRQNSSREYLERMGHFAIPDNGSLGVPVPAIRSIANNAIASVKVAMDLWDSGMHEARILSTLIYPVAELTRNDVYHMAAGLDSWDLCDHFTGNLLSGCDFPLELVSLWHMGSGEFIKRAAFSLIASLDSERWYTLENVKTFLAYIEEASVDGRNFVWKAVSWALRAIGKSSPENNSLAIAAAERIGKNGTTSGRRIMREAIRELNSNRIRKKLGT